MLFVLFYKIVDVCLLEDCLIEFKKGVLVVNVGYGGVYFSGDFGEDFDYDMVFYVGLFFFLGNSVFVFCFFSNMYIGFGLFL